MKTQIERSILLTLIGGAAALASQLAPQPPARPNAAAAVAAAPAPAPAAPVAVAPSADWQVAPEPPAPPAAPMLAVTPAAPAPPAPQVAPVPPVPPAAPAPGDWQDSLQDIQDRIQAATDKAMLDQDKAMQIQEKVWDAQEKAWSKANEKFALDSKPFNFDFNFDLKNTLPFALQAARPISTRIFRFGNVDSLYERGRRELDQRNWDQAVTDFTEVAGRGGSRADGALYWKAYALNKLGRRDEALAAIAELRKNFASSHWLDDANALEVEVKQSAGGTVAPDSTSDDEIKLLALNGLMQSDPDRAYPYLEKMLKSATSPRLKEQTLYVLAQSSSPKAQQALLQIAKGGGNPDLQLTAIRYLSAANRRQGTNNTVLFEIYNSSNDPAVKREALNALSASRDKDHLAEIARTEKNHDLQLEAIRRLGSLGPQAGAADALVALYAGAQEKDTKREIINVLSGQRNAKSLVDLGRKEKELEMKKYIVERLVGMNTPESKQFLEEILK